MNEMGDGHHFDGDGCAIYGADYPLKVISDRNYGDPDKTTETFAESLEQDDIWRDPARDGARTWWLADEVVYLIHLGGGCDEVHVKYSETDPYE